MAGSRCVTDERKVERKPKEVPPNVSVMFRSLKIRNYRVWFGGALISNVGGWMQATAQNWVVLTELSNNDATAVGITMALQFGPQLFLMPFTGAVADRIERRKILLFTQSTLMLFAIALGVLLVLGQAELWHVYGFAAGLGIVNAFDTPARQVFVSDLVGTENLSNAVALNSATFNSARLIGPAVAGVLIAAVGSGWVFIINSATFIAMLFALAMIRIEKRTEPPGERVSQLKQLTAGFKYVRSRQDLLVVFAIIFVIGSLGMNFPLFASTMTVEFDRGSEDFGLLTSVLAIGSLTGALIVAKRPSARLRSVILAAAGFGIAGLAAAVMPTFWAFAAVLVLFGYTTSMLLSTANAFVQTTTDASVRGRVLSLYFAILMGSTLIGAPTVGVVADAFGPRWGVSLAGVSGIVAFTIGASWLIISRRLRVHVGPGARLSVSHIGRARNTRPEDQEETLTAPIRVLGRQPVIMSEAESAPQDGVPTEAMTAPIVARHLQEAAEECPDGDDEASDSRSTGVPS